MERLPQEENAGAPVQWVTRFVTARKLVVAMMILQLLWLGGIWLTNATTAVHKLLPLTLYTILAGVLLTLSPTPILSKPMQKILASEKRCLLLMGALILIVGIIYAVNQRVWPFDEEGILAAATVVAEEGVRSLFEQYGENDWLGRQHPPLVPILYGSVMRLFGTQRIVPRLLTLVFTLATGLLTYLIGEDLYDKRTGLIAAAILFSFPLVLRLGTAALLEMVLAFFFTLTLWLTLPLAHKPTWPRLLVIGMAVGAGMLTKYTMVLVLPIALLFIALVGSWRQALWYVGVLGSLGALLFLAWLLLADGTAILRTQLETILHYAGLVLTNEYGRSVLFETVTNRLPSALGVYNLPLFAFGVLFLLSRRAQADWLIVVWVFFIWAPLMLTLPDHRYFLSSFPAVALSIAQGIQQIPRAVEKGVLLALLYAGGSLYLFMDWARAAHLFIE